MVSGVRFITEDLSFLPQIQTNAKSCFTLRSSRGPLGTDTRNPVTVRSYQKLLENYGNPVANIDDHLIARQALDRGSVLVVSRVSHIDDASKATVTVQDRLGVAGPATLTSNAGPFDFLDNTDLVFDVNGTPQAAVNFTGTAATQDTEDPGAGATGWNLGGENLIVTVTLPGQSTTTQYEVVFSDSFSGSVPADPDNYTQLETIAQINAAVGGVSLTVVGNVIRFTTDKVGNGATIALSGSASGASFLNVSSAIAGTGNVTDLNFVTPAEVQTVVDTASVSGLAVVTLTNSNTQVVFTTVSTGASATLGFDAPSLAAARMGFTVGAGGDTTGVASSAQTNTLRFDSESESDEYNGLQFTVTDNTSDSTKFDITVATQTTSGGFIVSVAEKHEQLDLDESSTRYVVRILQEQSKILRAVNLNSAKAAPSNNPATGTYTLSGGDRGLANLTHTDFFGTVTNRSGVRGFDDITDAPNLFVPGLGPGDTGTVNQERDQVFSIAEYCKNRADIHYFFCSFPNPNDVSDMIDYTNGTGTYAAGTQFNNRFLALYGGRVVELDFSNQRRELYGDGHLAGVLAFNDTGSGRLLQNFGPWFAPAGVKRGLLNSLAIGALNIGSPSRTTDRASLETAQINMFADFDGRPQVHDQRNTQRSPTLLRELNVSRFLVQASKDSVIAVRDEQWDPLDPIFFRNIANRLNSLWTQFFDLRAISEPARIRCDQNVDSINDVQVNNLVDLQNGIFRCLIFIKPVTAAREIVLVGVVTALNADFDAIEV